MSDEIEMVRRSERALGIAIRERQARGEIRSNGQRTDRAFLDAKGSKDFVTHGQELNDIYAMTDNLSDEEFDTAITAAKEEGNLSRANVVRKVQELSTYHGPAGREVPPSVARVGVRSR